MRGYERTSLVIIIISAVLVGIVLATVSVPAQDNPGGATQQKFDMAEFESQFPVTDVNQPEPADPKARARWQAKGKRYAGMGVSITDSSEIVTVNNEWDLGLSALPVAESDLVVVGEVTDAQAYLSGEKTWVYSEFTVRVDELLKNTSSLTLTRGSSLIAGRDGGRVRFPSGNTTLQYVRGQGMPRVGRRYVLFLTYTDPEQGAHILTGYELRGGRVFPLDNPAGGQHPLATVYKGADETALFNDLRTAIVNRR